MTVEDIMQIVKRGYMEKLFSKGIRLDGRGFMDFRDIKVKLGPISTAEGSALVSIGSTTVLAGVKFEVVEPFPQEPNLGVIITNAELLPLASKKFDMGPPDAQTIEFSRVVDRGIRSADVVDLESFFIEEGKVLGLFLDLYVLNYDGNLFDAGALAAISALKNTKMPKVEDGQIIRGEYVGKLKIREVPIAITFYKFKEWTFLDANIDEEVVSEATLTLTVTGEHIVSVQKRGRRSLKREEVYDFVDKAFEKRKELLQHIPE